FLLAHFAADDFVAGARIATDLNAPDVYAAARIHVKGKIGFVRFAIQHWIGIDVGKGISQRAEIFGDCLGGFVGFGGGKRFTGLDLDQFLYVVVQPEQITRQLDAAHRVGLAFVQRVSDEDIFTVWRDRDLRRLGRIF